jgi:hypothetical protein
MNRRTAFLFALVFTFSGAMNSYSQNRTMGAQRFVLDDGSGHTYTIQVNGTLTGNYIYNLPTPPAGNPPAGFVNVGTTAGQTLFWNGTNLDWEASSVITNNTNGNGTNVTITAPLIVSNTMSSTGATTLGTTAGTVNTFGNGGGATHNQIGNTTIAGSTENDIGDIVSGTGTMFNFIGGNQGSNALTNQIGVGFSTGTIDNQIGSNQGAGTVTNFIGTSLAGPVLNSFGSTTAGSTNTYYGTSSFANALTANNFASSGAAITGGSLNSTPVGATTPSTGAFTSLTATTSIAIGSNFTVASTGDVTKLKGVAYSWPAAQASAVGQVLTNDAAGNLTWNTAGSNSAQVVSTNSTYTGGGSLGTNQNDLAINASSAYFKINTTANVNVTGVNATGSADGRVVYFSNVGAGAFTVTFNNQNAGSAAADRFILPGGFDVTIAPGSSAIFIYDATAQRWRLLGNN